MALPRSIGQPEPNAPEIPPQNGDVGRITPIALGEAGRVTPMMEQYQEIKAAHPDCLLFYRMGDFYELFFTDAEIASRALGIVLTKRGKHLVTDIPMCGVPIERADEYLHRLIAQGHRVAVCEQLEDPAEARKRGAKSVVRRDVVRLVTPGTLTEDSLLDARRNNYLLAVARARMSSSGDDSRFALAWIDISTGEFRVSECDRATLSAEIARLEPGEIIVSDALYGEPDLAAFWRSLPAVTPLARDVFDGATAERRLTSFFAVSTSEAFGALTRLEITAAAACVTYVERTQIGQRPPLSPPLRESAGASMAIDQATRGNLELMRTLSGERRGSLLDAIDRTVTAAGSRLHDFDRVLDVSPDHERRGVDHGSGATHQWHRRRSNAHVHELPWNRCDGSGSARGRSDGNAPVGRPGPELHRAPRALGELLPLRWQQRLERRISGGRGASRFEHSQQRSRVIVRRSGHRPAHGRKHLAHLTQHGLLPLGGEGHCLALVQGCLLHAGWFLCSAATACH